MEKTYNDLVNYGYTLKEAIKDIKAQDDKNWWFQKQTYSIDNALKDKEPVEVLESLLEYIEFLQDTSILQDASK